MSTQGAILYSTTFPCHECAKMIIGAGIVEVHYIEPYPKSLVGHLYRHLIDTSPPVKAAPGLVGSRVPFYQFLGIAPRYYMRAFAAAERKTGDKLVAFDRKEACPRTPNWSAAAVTQAQSVAIAAISQIVTELTVPGDEPAVNARAESPPKQDVGAQRSSRS